MKKTVEVVLSRGVEGLCIYVNDHRICGPKPWGGGKTVKRWTVEIDEIKESIGIIERPKATTGE